MSKVYLAVAIGAPDQLLGHVDESGEVSLDQLGLDTVVGHVNLTTGDIYDRVFWAHKKVGHVDLSSGRVYISCFGPDQHVGQVAEDGRMNLHKALAADDYVGNVDQVLCVRIQPVRWCCSWCCPRLSRTNQSK